MNSNIKELIKNGYIAQDISVKNLSHSYLTKAKNNLITMNLLFELKNNTQAKNLLEVPKEYNPDEWIVICGYYAMYSSALALLAKIGFRSKNHAATLQVLEEYFVKKNILTSKDFFLFKNALLQKEELEKLSDARHKREIAQYSVTKQTTKEISETIRKNAYEFANKVELILEE